MSCFAIEHEFEQPATTLVTSFLFQCNLFKVLPNTNNAAAQCLVCKKNGIAKYCKGKTTSNYHLHMKVKNAEFFFVFLDKMNFDQSLHSWPTRGWSNGCGGGISLSEMNDLHVLDWIKQHFGGSKLHESDGSMWKFFCYHRFLFIYLSIDSSLN